MCEDCKGIKKVKDHNPHKYLVHKTIKEYTSQFGRVDEIHYKCSKCSSVQIYETGNYGNGWI